MSIVIFLLLVFFPLVTHAATYGVDNVTAVTTGDMFVDGSLSADCTAGDYSIANRNCTGADGDAYNTIAEGLSNSATTETILIRSGSYTAAFTLTSRILVAYNDETVTITTSGIDIAGTGAQLRDVTVVGTSGVAVTVLGTTTNAVMEYVTVTGCGTTGCKAGIIFSNAVGARISGNDIRSAQGATKALFGVDAFCGTIVENNRFRQESTQGQDSFHVNSGSSGCATQSVIRDNWFDTNLGENYVDLKALGATTVNILFTRNQFDGLDMDQGLACMILWGQDPAKSQTVVWEYNFWDRCGQAINQKWAPGAPTLTKSIHEFRNNIIYCDGRRATSLGTDGTNIHHNTFLDCEVDFGGARAATSGTVRSNIFETVIWDSSGDSTGWTCTHNNIRNATGSRAFSCSNETSVDPQFAGADDYNILNATLIGGAHDGANVGAHRELAFVSGVASGTSVTYTFSTDGTLPIQCGSSPSLFDIEYDNVDQTESSCAEGPLSNQITVTMASSPGAGQTVSTTLSYGAVVDSFNIGGPENQRNNALKAVTETNLTNQSSGTWVANTEVTAPAGDDRIGLIGVCWVKGAVGAVLSTSSMAYGGQAATLINRVQHGGSTRTVAELWYVNEAAIAAATNSTITYTLSEAADASRPELIGMGFYTNVNQVTPIVANAVTSSGSATSLTTAAIDSDVDGAAVILGCATDDAITYTVDVGWTKQLDHAVGNGNARIGAADIEATDGNNVTPTLNISVAHRFGVVAATIAATATTPPDPPAATTYTQTHVAGYRHGVGTARFCPLDGTCRLAIGRRFVARAQVEVEGDAAPSRNYEWWCADNGGLFYEVTDTSSGWVSYAGSSRDQGVALSNELALDGDTFASCGTHYSAPFDIPTPCSTSDVGYRFEYEFSGVLSSDAVPGQSVVCRLRSDGLALDAYTEDFEILVTTPSGVGF